MDKGKGGIEGRELWGVLLGRRDGQSTLRGAASSGELARPDTLESPPPGRALCWFHTNGLCVPLGSWWGWGCQPSLGFPAAFPAIVLPCSSDQLGCCEAARVSGARPRLRGTELS